MKRTFIRRNECGQATMEFLILLPLLLAILGLIAYSGWWSYAHLSAQNFLYANCAAVARSRGYLTVSPRGFIAADNTRPFWQYEAVNAPPELESRLGSKDCNAVLKNNLSLGPGGIWNLIDLAEAHGFAPYPPFMSCDLGPCH